MKQIKIVDQENGNNFIFYDVGDNGTILREFEGFEYPSVLSSVEDVASNIGAVFVHSKFGRRRLSWSGDIVTSDVFSIRRQMLTPMSQNGRLLLLQFTTYDDLDLQCEAVIESVRNPYTHMVHTYLIEAIAPDWRFYSQDLVTQLMSPTVIAGGTGIPTPIPMSLSDAGEGELENEITNDGNEQTFPVLTVSGPGTGFTITNTETGESFYLDITLNSTQQIIIDSKARTVVRQNGQNAYSFFEGDFIMINPGSNLFTFLVDSGSTEDTSLEVEYRHAYRGV